MKPYTVLICGSRDWTNRAQVREMVEALPEEAVVIHGGARGADTLAGQEARRRGLAVREFPADWQQHGKGAGPIRNQQMLNERPELVIAFSDWLGETRGTCDMVRRSVKAGVTVRVVGNQGVRPGLWALENEK